MFEKKKAKKTMQAHAICTPKGHVFYQDDDNVFSQSLNINFPLIVKLEEEDASIGIHKDSVVYNYDEMKQSVMRVWKQNNQATLVEEYIDGREFNITVLGDLLWEHDTSHSFRPRVLSISEIDFSGMPKEVPNIVTYDSKWEKDSVEYQETKPVCPAKINRLLEEEIKDVSMAVFKLFECRDYACVDIRLSPEVRPYVIDANPNPDISSQAGVALCAKESGLDYPDLLHFWLRVL